MRRRGRWVPAVARVGIETAVLGRLCAWEWHAYHRDRCAVDRVVAVRLGQRVRS